MIELGTAPVTVAAETEGEPARRALTAEAGERRFALNLEGVRYSENPGVTYEVYLNLPEGAPPSYHSPHYVGNVGFFAFQAGGEAAAGEAPEGGGGRGARWRHARGGHPQLRRHPPSSGRSKLAGCGTPPTSGSRS